MYREDMKCKGGTEQRTLMFQIGKNRYTAKVNVTCSHSHKVIAVQRGGCIRSAMSLMEKDVQKVIVTLYRLHYVSGGKYDTWLTRFFDNDCITLQSSTINSTKGVKDPTWNRTMKEFIDFFIHVKQKEYSSETVQGLCRKVERELAKIDRQHNNGELAHARMRNLR